MACGGGRGTMEWPRDTGKLLQVLLRALGLCDWQINAETWRATVAPDPISRTADLALAEGPKDRREAIELLAHEASHMYASQFCVDPHNILSAIRWDQLAADLVTRLDADAANEIMEAAQTDGGEFDEEAFADAMAVVLAARLRRGMK